MRYYFSIILCQDITKSVQVYMFWLVALKSLYNNALKGWLQDQLNYRYHYYHGPGGTGGLEIYNTRID